MLFPESRLGIAVESFEEQFHSIALAVFIIFSLLDVAILKLVLKKGVKEGKQQKGRIERNMQMA